MSLRLRIVLAVAAVLLASTLAGVALAGWQARKALHEELSAALTGGRQTVESAFEDLPRSDHPARDLRQLIATFDGNRHVAAALFDAAGQPRLASRPAAAAPSPSWFGAILATPVAPQRIAAPVPGSGAVVLTPYFKSDVAALWTEFVDLTGVLALALLAGCTLVWVTVGRALRPLSDLSLAFVRIGSGDYGVSVPEAGPTELSRLGAGVNEMSRRLAAVQARNKALEAQLRTLQDEERADLARDLHDELGPHLFAANVDAVMARRMIEEGRGPEALGQLEALQAGVGHMQRLVRDILGRLRPTELIELGLGAAVDELVTFWRARHPDIAFAVRLPDDEAVIADALRETVYRIVQEALGNAVRHARARRIEIEIAPGPDGGVVCRVTDDGAASREPDLYRPTGGFGLIGMRERVAAAHGRLTIAKVDQGGWSVVAHLPAPHAGVQAA
jgi:two-component system, NarL family, sensor histidine kinase UhpB